ncbi:hypothetical protein TK90_2675 (plasmid) [Thioalkalivibrio sp. K90mix]|uniref:hypothetical protein n=1 Tax=Thioalkalivibrio sp. (strain K90mix) TaxID=396595 RepID=UPI000195A3C0|nr:hypothetical protein [Thioalkalivibrio sp. K90mix]ADC73162.1 hypothetical protein TK90_2675 [Thioalkalivibrio sp. K90mix]
MQNTAIAHESIFGGFGRIIPFDLKQEREALLQLESALRMAEKFQEPAEEMPVASLRMNASGELEIHAIGAEAILEAFDANGVSPIHAVWKLRSDSDWQYERMVWAFAIGAVQAAYDAAGAAGYFAELIPEVRNTLISVWGRSPVSVTSPVFGTREEALEWLADMAEEDTIEVTPERLAAGKPAATLEMALEDLQRRHQMMAWNHPVAEPVTEMALHG